MKRTDRYGFVELPKESLSLKLTINAFERAIDLFSLILTFINYLGWKIYIDSDKNYIEIDKQKVAVRIKEKIKQVEHELTEQERIDRKRRGYSFAPKYDYLSTGELSLEIDQYNSYDQKNVWKIEESKLGERLLVIIEAVWTIAQWSYESNLVRIQDKIEEDIRAKELAKRDHEIRIQHNRVKILQSAAKSWREIQDIKSFLNELELCNIQPSKEKLVARDKWVNWARKMVEHMSVELIEKAVHDDEKIFNLTF